LNPAGRLLIPRNGFLSDDDDDDDDEQALLLFGVFICKVMQMLKMMSCQALKIKILEMLIFV
jgi:hypothetical protein